MVSGIAIELVHSQIPDPNYMYMYAYIYVKFCEPVVVNFGTHL